LSPESSITGPLAESVPDVAVVVSGVELESRVDEATATIGAVVIVTGDGCETVSSTYGVIAEAVYES